MANNIFAKTPNGQLDYSMNWADKLSTAASESISTSAWASIPTGLTLSGETNTTAATAILISGGTHGTKYHVTNTITTNVNSRRYDRSIAVEVYSPL